MSRRLLSAGLALIVVLSLAACGSEPLADNQARTPASSKDFAGEDYHDVVAVLSDAGFSNVESRALGDLITGWLNSPDTVEDVEIGGVASFGKGDVFPKDVRIVVSYHSFPVEEEDEPEDTTDPSSSAPATEDDEEASDADPSSGIPVLAAQVRAEFLDFWQVEKESDLLPYYRKDPVAPTYAIYQWEDAAGWVRVYLQVQLTEKEAHAAGKQILGLTCGDFPRLAGIIVQGADGLDINVPRAEMPLCNP